MFIDRGERLRQEHMHLYNSRLVLLLFPAGSRLDGSANATTARSIQTAVCDCWQDRAKAGQAVQAFTCPSMLPEARLVSVVVAGNCS